MNGKNFEVGSVWRRWDLHIHTPETKKNDQFSGKDPIEKWAKFSEDINIYTDIISVVGVTDYFSIENYFKFKKYLTEGKITKQFDLVLPNIELRIYPVAASGTPINIHCIVNPQFEEKIEDRLLRMISFNFKNRPYNTSRNSLIELGRDYKENKTLDEEAAYRAGIAQFVVPFDQLKSIFEKDEELKNNVVIVVSNSTGDGASGLMDHYSMFEGKQTSGLDATRRNIYTFSDAIFSSNKGDIDYFLGQKKNVYGNIVDDISVVKKKCGSLKPCFHGCDAHGNSKIFKPDNDLFCWVKADPTFEGLKQVLYEPTERVKIQKSNPALDFDRPVFEEIDITQDVKVFSDASSLLKFNQGKIVLNPGMVSIVGGRGQGKSMLINYKGFGLGKDVIERLSTRFMLNDKFKVKWKQSLSAASIDFQLSTRHDLPFTFIHQSKVKEVADGDIKLKDEVLSMLNGLGYARKWDDISEVEVKKSIDLYVTLLEWLDRKNESGLFVNSTEFIENKIKEVDFNINLVTEGSNKDNLEKYALNIEKISQSKLLLSRLRALRNKIVDYRDSINKEIANFQTIIPIDTSNQQKDILTIYRRTLSEIDTIEGENSRIKSEKFKNYRGDLVQLLGNISVYQSEKSALAQNISEVTDNEVTFLKTKKDINGLILKYKNQLIADKDEIDNIWNNKIFDNPERSEVQNSLIKNILKNRNIEIAGKIVLNESRLLELLEKCIDGRYIRPKSKERILGLLNLSADHLLENVLDITIEKIEEVKKNNENCFFEDKDIDIIELFLNPRFREQYIYVVPQITVDGKEMMELSAGQRGTTYLCLKLATQLFTGPIVFDQPEDDLDNDFITNELIDLFKEIKKYRQIIIVSHNANLVVNSDSDQVILANNMGEVLTYQSGALENLHVNQKICKILEGGELAFEKRRDKYRKVR